MRPLFPQGLKIVREDLVRALSGLGIVLLTNGLLDVTV